MKVKVARNYHVTIPAEIRKKMGSETYWRLNTMRMKG